MWEEFLIKQIAKKARRISEPEHSLMPKREDEAQCRRYDGHEEIVFSDQVRASERGMRLSFRSLRSAGPFAGGPVGGGSHLHRLRSSAAPSEKGSCSSRMRLLQPVEDTDAGPGSVLNVPGMLGLHELAEPYKPKAPRLLAVPCRRNRLQCL